MPLVVVLSIMDMLDVVEYTCSFPNFYTAGYGYSTHRCGAVGSSASSCGAIGYGASSCGAAGNGASNYDAVRYEASSFWCCQLWCL